MNFSEIRELGESIARAVAGRDFNDTVFTSVAEDALQKLQCPDAFDPHDICAYIQSPGFPQQISWQFSDLPILAYRDRNFYIEVLIWAKATARIHQHGFCGAFKVLSGSSLHTQYSFDARDSVGNDVLVGDLRASGSEYLEQGSVRKILAGSSGLIHSLYHLDNPSVSLVVRTYGHSSYGPQFSYHKPGLAINEFAYARDDVVVALDRLMGVVGQWDRKAALDLLLNEASTLDFARSAMLLLRNIASFESDEQLRAYCQLVERRHGPLAHLLLAAAQHARVAHSIIDARVAIADPELRFFLALLLNVPTRHELLQVVSTRFPQCDPVAQCAQWMVALGRQRGELKAKFARIAGALELEAHQLGARVGRVLQKSEFQSGQAAMLETILRQGLAEPVDGTGTGQIPCDLVLRQQLAEIAELSPLFGGCVGDLCGVRD